MKQSNQLQFPNIKPRLNVLDPQHVVTIKQRIEAGAYPYGVIFSDDIGYVESDVGGGFENLHLYLHIADDAEVAIDEGLKFD